MTRPAVVTRPAAVCAVTIGALAASGVVAVGCHLHRPAWKVAVMALAGFVLFAAAIVDGARS